jgi:hypothetical protein
MLACSTLSAAIVCALPAAVVGAVRSSSRGDDAMSATLHAALTSISKQPVAGQVVFMERA